MCFILFFEGGPQTDGSFLWGAIWFGAIFAPHGWVVLQKLPSLCSHLWGIFSWPSFDTAKPQPNNQSPVRRRSGCGRNTSASRDLGTVVSRESGGGGVTRLNHVMLVDQNQTVGEILAKQRFPQWWLSALMVLFSCNNLWILCRCCQLCCRSPWAWPPLELSFF